MTQTPQSRRFVKRASNKASMSKMGRSKLRRLMVESLEDRRLLNVDWRNPVDAVDVDNDGSNSPLDALVVINTINAGGSGALAAVRDTSKPYYDVDGDQNVSPLDVLSVINHLNANSGGVRSLAESGSQFVQETSVTITLGQTSGTRDYRVRIDSQFDTSDSSTAVEDLLAVYLVDPKNPTQTLLDRGTNGTALFTLAGNKAELVPGRVSWDGSVLEINLSDLALSDTGLLKFQLINADNDRATTLSIQPLSNLVDTQGTLASKLSLESTAVNAGSSLTLSSLTPFADGVLQFSNVRFNAATGKYNAELRLRNDGASLGRNIAVVFPGLPAGVTLSNPSGTTTTGSPYVNLKPAIARGGLTQGAWSEPVTIEFNNPGQTPFAIKPQVLGAANRAPSLAAINTLAVMPGGVLKVPLLANDPDGDPLVYSIVPKDGTATLPSSVVDASGVLIFRPTPSQLGAYQFDVIASDGVLEAVQSVTLNVVADPVTTTRISGKILKVNGQPLASMPVQIGAVQGLTQADGSFLLDLGSGTVVSDTIKVRGELMNGPASYPFIAEKLAFILEHEVYAHVNNVIDRPIYLPEIDVANGKTIDPTRNITVTSNALPGAKVEVAASTLMNQQGTPFTGVLSMTEVPVELTPAALPEGMRADLVVTIQPGEMVFTRPTPLSLPNRGGYAPGTLLDLWSINPITGEFDKVGTGQVNAAGTVIDTINGGIRNSSWHYFDPPVRTGPKADGDPRNKKPSGPPACETATSSCELHSGALIETHDLVTYQSQGIQRGLTLTYDSLRADPRPIVHFTFDDLDPQSYSVPSVVRLIAELEVSRDGVSTQVPGFQGGAYGLSANANIWRLPADAGSVDAALQVDLRDQPTGVYDYTLRAGMLGYAGARGYIGTLNDTTGQFTSVNSQRSPFGAGWSIAGLLELVENRDGSLLLINGNGNELLYAKNADGSYKNPPGEFANLSKLPNGTFRRVWPDQSVEQYGANNKLASMTDRNGNVSRYEYDSAGRLTKFTDPVGLETTLTYTTSSIEIVDPAARTTLLNLDANGNLIRVTDPNGSSRQWRYDSQHHMTGETNQLGYVETASYGFHGRVTNIVRKDGSTRQFFPIDVQGLFPPEQTAADPVVSPLANPIAGRVPLPESVVADSNGNMIRNKLDELGQSVSASDSVGSLPSNVRNSDNLPIISTSASGAATFNTFDSRGKLLTSQDSMSVRLGDTPSIIGLLNGNLQRQGESDRYSFAGKAGELISIDKMAGNPTIDVLTPSGMALTTDRLPQDGTYQVTVGNFKGAYKAAIRSKSYAQELTVGTRVLQGFEAGEDIIYRFTALRNQRFTLSDASVNAVGSWQVTGPNNLSVNLIRFQDTSDYEFMAPLSGEYYLIHSTDVSVTNPGLLDFTTKLLNPEPISNSGFGTTYAGTLQQGEEKRISFTGAQGAFIYLDNLGQRDQLTFELRDPQGRVLPKVDYQSSRVLGDNLIFQLNSSGTFEFVIKRIQSGSSGTYQFRIEDLASATPSQFGSVIQATLATANGNKASIYRFSGTAGQRIFIDSAGSHFMMLFLSTVSPYGRNRGNDGIYTLPYTGDYYLIFDISDDTSANFTFRAFDLNQMPSIQLGDAVPGTVGANAPMQKYYRFVATPGETVHFGTLSGLFSQVIVFEEGLRLSLDQSLDRVTLSEDAEGITEPKEYVLSATAIGNVELQENSFRLKGKTESFQPFVLGQTVTADIEPNHVDTYSFQGVQGTSIYLDWRKSTLGDGRVEWQLIGPAGPITPYAREGDLRQYDLPATGEYQLQVSKYSGIPSNYEFQLFDVAEVSLASIGTPISRELANGSVSNLFQLNLVAGQRLQLEQSTSTTQLELISPSGRSVFKSAMSNFAVVSETGKHLLVVTSINQSTESAVPYEWLISLANDAPVSTSGLGVSYRGAAIEGEQVATFQANAGTQVLILSSHTTTFNQLTLLIIDPFGETIKRFNLEWNSIDEMVIVLPRSGQYTVQAVGRNRQLTSPTNYEFYLTDLSSLTKLGPGVSYPVPDGFDLFPFSFDAVAGQQYLLQANVKDSIDTSFDAYRYFNVSASMPFDAFGFSNSISNGVPKVAPKSGTYIGFARTFFNGMQLSVQLNHINAQPKLPIGTNLTGANSLHKQDVIRRVDVAAGDKLLLQAESSDWSVYDPSAPDLTPMRWERVETSPGNFVSEAIVSFAKAGTVTLMRLGTSRSSLDYSMRLTRLGEPVTPLVGGTLTGTALTYDPAFNQPTSKTDQEGRQTLYDVDPANGNILSVTKVVGQVGGSDDLVSRFTYTASGQIDTTTDAIGRITDFDYDSRGRIIASTRAKGTPLQTLETYEYDVAGNLIATIDANGNRSTYQYDAMGRLTRITLPDPDAAGPLQSPITVMTYDAVGNLLKATDPLGNNSTRTYDAMNRMLSITNLGNNITKYAYDQVGNVIQTTDAIGNVSRMRYDSRNRMTTSIDAAGFETHFAYDINDNLVSLTDASGNVTRYEYDDRDRRVAEIDPFGKRTTFVYNSADELIGMTDRIGRMTKLAYDDVGRLTQESWIDANSNIVNTVDYSFDAADRLVRLRDGVTDIRVTFNELDQATRAESGGVAGVPIAVFDATYDAMGNRLSVTDTIQGSVGARTTYVHDALDRIVRQTQSSAPGATNSTADKRVEFAYNAMDQLTSISRFADLASSQSIATSQFAYDALNRLTNLSHRNASNIVLNGFSYTYDADSRVTRITDIDGSTDYAYDKRDQLTGANHADATNPDENYGYDATGNRIASTRHGSSYVTGQGNRQTTDGINSYEYDAEGNLVKQTNIASGAVRELAWDHRNRLVRVTDRPSSNGAPTQVAEFAYDATNRRISKTVAGVTTHFIYDGENVIVELTDPDASGPQQAVESARYLHGPFVDQVLAQEFSNGDVQWMLTDHLGTVRDLVSNDGQVVNHVKYDSYGNVISESNASVKTRYKYTGREFDSETGLQYNRARYYDAAIGRFLSEDPIGFEGEDANLYGYVRNSPLLHDDPAGTVPILIIYPTAVLTGVLILKWTDKLEDAISWLYRAKLLDLPDPPAESPESAGKSCPIKAEKKPSKKKPQNIPDKIAELERQIAESKEMLKRGNLTFEDAQTQIDLVDMYIRRIMALEKQQSKSWW